MPEIYDGPWRLFSWDPAIGRSVWVLWEDGRAHFRVSYKVENLIRDNSEARSAAAGARFGEFSRVASIPINVYQDSGMQEAVAHGDSKFVRRFLNNSDHSAWRTRGGRA